MNAFGFCYAKDGCNSFNLNKLLSDFEKAEYKKTNNKKRFILKRYVAKKAFSNALEKCYNLPKINDSDFSELTIEHDVKGKPLIRLSKSVEKKIDLRKLISIKLSLSDELDGTIGVVVIEYKL